MKVWTGRYWMTEEHRKRISGTLKKHFKENPVWNKGKQYGEHKDFRADKKYYTKELEKNAKRNLKNQSNKEPKRLKQIKDWGRSMQERTGAGRPPQNWEPWEIEYLRSNYKETPVVDMAIHLNRSWSAVSHKLCRLKLTTYNKWNS